MCAESLSSLPLFSTMLDHLWIATWCGMKVRMQECRHQTPLEKLSVFWRNSMKGNMTKAGDYGKCDLDTVLKTVSVFSSNNYQWVPILREVNCAPMWKAGSSAFSQIVQHSLTGFDNWWCIGQYIPKSFNLACDNFFDASSAKKNPEVKAILVYPPERIFLEDKVS